MVQVTLKKDCAGVLLKWGTGIEERVWGMGNEHETGSWEWEIKTWEMQNYWD